MEFAGNWIEVEIIIISEVTETTKGKHCVFSSM